MNLKPHMDYYYLLQLPGWRPEHSGGVEWGDEVIWFGARTRTIPHKNTNHQPASKASLTTRLHKKAKVNSFVPSISRSVFCPYWLERELFCEGTCPRRCRDFLTFTISKPLKWTLSFFLRHSGRVAEILLGVKATNQAPAILNMTRSLANSVCITLLLWVNGVAEASENRGLLAQRVSCNYSKNSCNYVEHISKKFKVTPNLIIIRMWSYEVLWCNSALCDYKQRFTFGIWGQFNLIYEIYVLGSLKHFCTIMVMFFFAFWITILAGLSTVVQFYFKGFDCISFHSGIFFLEYFSIQQLHRHVRFHHQKNT